MRKGVESLEQIVRLVFRSELELDVYIHAARASEGRIEGAIFVRCREQDAPFLCSDAIERIQETAEADTICKVRTLISKSSD